MRHSRPDRASAMVPIRSGAPRSLSVHQAYTMHATKRKAVTTPNTLYSDFTEVSPRSADRKSVALGRERPRRGGQRGLTDRGQRLGRGLPGLLGRQEGGVLLG